MSKKWELQKSGVFRNVLKKQTRWTSNCHTTSTSGTEQISQPSAISLTQEQVGGGEINDFGGKISGDKGQKIGGLKRNFHEC